MVVWLFQCVSVGACSMTECVCMAVSVLSVGACSMTECVCMAVSVCVCRCM